MLKTVFCIITCFFICVSFGQTKPDEVSIELSIPHTGELPRINDNSSYTKAYILIHNNTDVVNYFYEDWCTYGYFSLSLELKCNDSIYQLQRSRKIWYRNFHSYHTVRPGETLVIENKIIDSTYAANTEEYRVFGDGWVGFPNFSDTVEIRVIYRLHDLNDSIPSENIGRLRYRKDDYKEYLDGDVEYTGLTDEIPKNPVHDPNPVIIFHEPLVSEWQKVVLMK